MLASVIDNTKNIVKNKVKIEVTMFLFFTFAVKRFIIMLIMLPIKLIKAGANINEKIALLKLLTNHCGRKLLK